VRFSVCIVWPDFEQSQTTQNVSSKEHFYESKIHTSVKFQSWVSVNRLPNNPALTATCKPGLSLRFNRKPGQRSTSKRQLTSISYKLEPVTWSHDTGQWIPCFDMCQLTMTCPVSKMYAVNQGCICYSWSMAAMLRDSFIIVVHTCPRATPLAMITMRKSIRVYKAR